MRQFLNDPAPYKREPKALDKAILYQYLLALAKARSSGWIDLH